MPLTIWNCVLSYQQKNNFSENGHVLPRNYFQGLTNPLSGCPGQVKIFAGQVKYFLTCPEKCIRYIGKTKEIQYFVAEVLYRTSRSNFDLLNPVLPLQNSQIAIFFYQQFKQVANGIFRWQICYLLLLISNPELVMCKYVHV